MMKIRISTPNLPSIVSYVQAHGRTAIVDGTSVMIITPVRRNVGLNMKYISFRIDCVQTLPEARAVIAGAWRQQLLNAA
jgi:hypothetical protein